MNPVYEAAVGLQEFVQAQGWRFCIIGGCSAGAWNGQRKTPT